jgi:chromosome partitioning protein
MLLSFKQASCYLVSKLSLPLGETSVIITFANTKGGVAKTTSAMLSALALSKKGDLVEVWDADPQGSASDWAMSARDSSDPLPFSVRSVNLAMLKRAQASEGSIVLIDTPPGDSQLIDASARISDLVVIPTDSSTLDVSRTLETFAALSGVPRAVLVVRAEERTRLLQDLLASLDEAEVPRFTSVIPKRQGIKDAFGTAASELFTYESFVEEVKEAAR